MKYKIPSVVCSAQMYWDFSTQNLNKAIAQLRTQMVKYEILLYNKFTIHI